MGEEMKHMLQVADCCGVLDSDEQICGSRVKRIRKPWHICFFMANICFPGLGTALSSCCCSD